MKRLIAILLVLVGVTFGLQTKWTSPVPASWDGAPNWSAGTPGSGDTAVFDGTGAGLCQINPGVCPNWRRLVLSSGSITMGAAVCTLYVRELAISGGTFTDGGGVVRASGSCDISGGTSAFTGVTWIPVSSNIKNSVAAYPFAELDITDAGSSGILATRTGDVYTKKLVIGQNDSVGGAYTTYVTPAADDFMTVVAGGTSTGGETEFRMEGSYSLAALTISESLTVDGAAITDTLEMTGNLTVRGFTIAESVAFNDGGDTVVPGYHIKISGDAASHVVSTGVWKMTDSGSIYNLNAVPLYRFITSNGASALNVRVVDDFGCRDIAVGENDTVICDSLLRVTDPDSNNFITLASGAALIGSSGVRVTLTNEGNFTNGAFAVSGPIQFSVEGDSLTATGAWASGGRVTLPNYNTGGSAVATQFDMDASVLTAKSFYFYDAAPSNTGSTFLAGSATHVVDTVLPVEAGNNKTLALESSVWRVASFDVTPTVFDSFALTSAGAVIRLQTTTTPSIKLTVDNIPTVRCSVNGNPSVYGGVGACSTLAIVSICDTVFLDTVDTDDTVKVVTAFSAVGDRGTTVLYGNAGTATKLSIPTATATVTDCKLANLSVLGPTKLKAYGNIPAGHLSHIQVRK